MWIEGEPIPYAGGNVAYLLPQRFGGKYDAPDLRADAERAMLPDGRPYSWTPVEQHGDRVYVTGRRTVFHGTPEDEMEAGDHAPGRAS